MTFFRQLQKLETALLSPEAGIVTQSPSFRSLYLKKSIKHWKHGITAGQHKDHHNFNYISILLCFTLLLIFNYSQTHEAIKLEGQTLPWHIMGITSALSLVAWGKLGVVVGDVLDSYFTLWIWNAKRFPIAWGFLTGPSRWLSIPCPWGELQPVREAAQVRNAKMHPWFPTSNENNQKK